MRASTSERPTSWQRAEEIGLSAVGVAAVVYAGWFEFIASGLGEVTSADVDLRVLAGAVGVATAVAGVLAIVRIREDVVGAVLGALTAAAFTLGATSLLQPTSGWRVMYPAAIFGGLLLGFLVFRRGFDRPWVRRADGTAGSASNADEK
jgi:hypothetical protein